MSIKNVFSSNPKDIIPSEWKEEPIRWLDIEIDNILEQISENERLNVLLYQYIERYGDKEITITYDDFIKFYHRTTAITYKNGFVKEDIKIETPKDINELTTFIKTIIQ